MSSRPAPFVVEHRVDIETHEVEVLAKLAAEIDVRQPTDVVENEPAWIGRAQDLHLILLKGRRYRCEETMIVLHVAWARK